MIATEKKIDNIVELKDHVRGMNGFLRVLNVSSNEITAMFEKRLLNDLTNDVYKFELLHDKINVYGMGHATTLYINNKQVTTDKPKFFLTNVWGLNGKTIL